jgi:signal transduction histidine kinase
MSATIARPPSPTTVSGGLGQLALSASRDLDGDIVITRRIAPGKSVVAACAGITRRGAGELLASLHALEARHSGTEALNVSELSRRDPAAGQLTAHGYVSTASLGVQAGRGRTGAIHVLRTVPGALGSPTLLQAYANHAAVSIAAERPHRSSPPDQPPTKTIEALDQLALSATSFPDLLSALDETLAMSFGPLSCGIALWDEQRRLLYFVPGSFAAEERIAVSCQVTLLNPNSNAARVFATGDPYMSNHAPGDPAILQEYVAAYDLHRLIAVRLQVQQRPIGVLYVANTSQDFRVSDIWRLEPLVPRISTAVECARAFFVLRTRHQLEQILSDVAVAIASGRSTADFLTPALGDLGETMDASVIALVPTDAGPIVWRSSYAYPARERELLVEAASQPGLRTHMQGTFGAGDPGSATILVPVKLGSERVGTLAVLRRRAEPFTEDERHALTRLAKLAALAREIDTYQQERAELARISERQRIADDLHDEVSQILFGANMSLDATLQLPELDERVATNVGRARTLLAKSDEVLRGIIGELSREAPADLVSALAVTVSEIEHEYKLPIHVHITERARDAATSLHRPLGKALLRAAREALINVGKHAGPCRAIVRLDVKGDRLRLSVADDGLGIDSRNHASRYGLASLRRLIRDQGGNLRVSRGAGGGTTLVVSFRL